ENVRPSSVDFAYQTSSAFTHTRWIVPSTPVSASGTPPPPGISTTRTSGAATACTQASARQAKVRRIFTSAGSGGLVIERGEAHVEAQRKDPHVDLQTAFHLGRGRARWFGRRWAQQAPRNL